MSRRREVPDSIAELRVPNPDRRYFEEGDDHPFLPDRTGFSLRNAWWLLEASFLAYVADTTLIERRLGELGLDRVVVAEHDDIRGLLAWSETTAFLLFRGTLISARSNLLADIDLRLVEADDGSGRVHRGFRNAFRSIRAPLEEACDRLPSSARLFLAGHSLGGALAVLASARFARARALYTFGAPRVGDDAFRRDLPDLPRYRVINEHDLVCQLPPAAAYRHVGEPHLVTKDGEHRSGEAAELSFRDRLRRNFSGRIPRLLERAGDGAAFRSELLRENVLSDHAPASYSARLWNAMLAEDTTS